MNHHAWFITRRWQEYAAERRANLLRIIAIGVFYLVHLWTYASSTGRVPQLGFLQLAAPGEVDERFHVAVTLLAVAWSMLALGVYLCLQQRIFPSWMPYASTGADIVLLTSIICLGGGPRSPLVAGYFLVLSLAVLRFNLQLVRFSTAAAAIGYVIVLGCAKWWPTFGKLTVDLRVPRYHQLIVLLAIIFAGVMLGQLVRRAKHVAVEYASRATGE